MSFFSDLFEGNFNQLGGDISHDPIDSALVGGGLALLTGGLAAPLLGADLGLGAGAAAADVGAGIAGDVGATTAAADLTAGAADLGAVGASDLGAVGALGAGDLGGIAAGDVGALGGASAGDLGSALAFAPDSTLASSGFDLGADSSGFLAPDASAAASAAPDATAGATSTAADTTAAAAPATTPTGGTASGLLQGTPAVNASTAGTAAPAAASGGTVTGMGGATAGSGGTLNSILSSPFTKLAIGAAPLALTLGMGETQLPAGAQQLQGQALALQQQGLTALNQAQQGVMNSGQTAQLTQMRNDLTNQWLQTLKNQGVQDPTKDARWPQIQAAIDAQVTQQTATLIQQNITNALAETGQASQALTQISNMQFQADQNFTNNLVNATKSLGFAAGTSNLPKITIGS